MNNFILDFDLFKEENNISREIVLDIEKLAIVQEIKKENGRNIIKNYLTAITKNGNQYPLMEVYYPLTKRLRNEL